MRTRGFIAGLLLFSLSACQCGGEGWCMDGATRPCPLQQGVCAGSVTHCVSGRWATCDYGSDHQLTERRCDGLDNDCDGTVDSSWVRTLLEGDAGRLGPNLVGDEVFQASLMPMGAALWLSLPNDVLILDEDLRVTARAEFPPLAMARARLFPTPGGAVRVAQEFNGVGPASSVVFQRLHSDGGIVADADGGPELLGAVTWPADFRGGGLTAAAVDGGWMAVVVESSYPTKASGPTAGWARLDQDGGLTSGFLDGGAKTTRDFLYATHLSAEFVVTITHPQSLDVYGVDWEQGALRLQSSVTGESCHLATLKPLTVDCGWPQVTWFEAGRGVVTPPFIGRVLHQQDWSGPVLAWTPPTPGNEAQAMTTLSLIRDGGLEPWANLGVASDPYGDPLREVHQVNERLTLLTGPTHVSRVCFGCPVESYVARYACLPP